MQTTDWAKLRKQAARKTERKAKRKAAKANRVIVAAQPKAVRKPADPNRFYLCRPWRELRYKALKQNDGRCELCGVSKHDGAQLHVDHILPRSKYPLLQLELTNLQVLCSDCNIGKSNLDTTDWRKIHDEWSWMDERMSKIRTPTGPGLCLSY